MNKFSAAAALMSKQSCFPKLTHQAAKYPFYAIRCPRNGRQR